MKIRQGFVSNSSTSSFLIFGKCFENYDLATEKLAEYSKLHPEAGIADVEDMEEYDIFEVICSIIGLEFWMPYGGEDAVYCGKSFDEMALDETRREFQDRILKSFQKLFPEMTIEDLSVYEEAWN